MRAVFLDRDGVISENRADHVKSWEEFQFIPGALDALRALADAGLPVFIVTNQAIVNRGVISHQLLNDMHARMLRQIVATGGQICDIAYCPHDYAEACVCRKPKPGMLVELARCWDVDLADSYMVGDAWTDMAAGNSVGCQCILVRTGRGNEQLASSEASTHTVDYIAADLQAAATFVLNHERHLFEQSVALPQLRRTDRVMHALGADG